MNRSTFCFTALLAASLSAQQDSPKDYQFQSPGLQFDGLQRLSELRGKPVLIEFWGIN